MKEVLMGILSELETKHYSSWERKEICLLLKLMITQRKMSITLRQQFAKIVFHW